MNQDQARELLMPFADGELDTEQAAQVQAAIAGNPELGAELAGLEHLSALARETIEAPAADVDFSGLYDGVMARIEASEASEAAIEGVKVERKVAGPSFMDRTATWLRELFTFEQPMVTIGSFAVLALLIGGIYWSQGSSTATPMGPASGPGDQAEVGDPAPELPEAVQPIRRGPENGASQVATIENATATSGKIVIETSDDPDIPAIVWHTIEGEAAPTEDTEL